MVLFLPPPPTTMPAPVCIDVPIGQMLYRVFDPAQFDARPVTFRRVGPISRFDHHRSKNASFSFDCDRGVLYAGYTFSCCLVEAFGDRRCVTVGTVELAKLVVTQQLFMLDLRKDAAMKAGSVAALTKDARFYLCQQWARFFYESTFLYGHIDGLIYGNAHNDEDSLALFERAEGKIECVNTIKLSDDLLRSKLRVIAKANGMKVMRY